MSDVGLFWDEQFGAADLSVVAGDLVQDGGLETAVLLSLFTNARDGDARGWWGDVVPVVSGDRFGSRLWTLAREKDTAAVLQRARELAREALAWLLEDKVAAAVEVLAERAPLSAGTAALVLTVKIHRPAAASVAYRYDYNWASQQARRA